VKDKTKRVMIDGTQYQIKRFAPDVGSFILGRILNSINKVLIETMKAFGDAVRDVQPAPATSPAAAPTQEQTEERIRRMATDAFGVMSFEERSVVQQKCLQVCARVETHSEETLMPLANANGCLVDDLQLILRLELETLVFNFYDFFAEGGLNALLKSPAPRT